MEGFNNLEQGVLIACAVACTLAVMWIAIAVSSASLRTIDMVHHLKRIAEQGEHVEVTGTPQAPMISPEAAAALMRASTPVKHEGPGDAFAAIKPEECDHRRAKAAIRKASMPEGEPITCPTCDAALFVGPRTDEGKPTVVKPEKASAT